MGDKGGPRSRVSRSLQARLLSPIQAGTRARASQQQKEVARQCMSIKEDKRAKEAETEEQLHLEHLECVKEM